MIFRIASLPQQTFALIRAYLLTHGFLTRRRPKIQRTRTMEKRASCARSRWMILTKWKRSCGAGRRKPNGGSLAQQTQFFALCQIHGQEKETLTAEKKSSNDCRPPCARDNPLSLPAQERASAPSSSKRGVRT